MAIIRAAMLPVPFFLGGREMSAIGGKADIAATLPNVRF
jgi:hypothetical protein